MQIVSVSLELDLLAMVLWSRFLGENFIKCILRYHAELPAYILELFCQQRENLKVLSKLSQTIILRVNLKLTNYPDAVSKVSHQLLLKNSVLR